MIKKLFILVLCTAISWSFFFCESLLDFNKIEPLITKIDMEEMAHRHLSGFSLARKSSRGILGTEYVFKRESDSVNIFITIGLYQSAEDAENVASDYFNDISMRMEKGPIPGESIGDKLWWWAPRSDPKNVTNIVFIRYNVLFLMSSHKYKELKVLAKAIDNDILGNASYIKVENRNIGGYLF
jgi:hypothetical protein